VRRDHKNRVSLNGDELARLDEMRVGASRAVSLRTLLQEPFGCLLNALEALERRSPRNCDLRCHGGPRALSGACGA
jgi:hypothetical protein